jgi:hypothetical protein
MKTRGAMIYRKGGLHSKEAGLRLPSAVALGGGFSHQPRCSGPADEKGTDRVRGPSPV